MKTSGCIVLVATLLAVLAAGIPGQAMADGYTWMQGDAAVTQSPSQTNWTRTVGMGLDLDQKHGTTNWIHIPVPCPLMGTTPKADKIKLFFATISTDVKVTAVMLYDGAYLRCSVPITPFSAPRDGYYGFVEIPLGGTYDFYYGMGVSLQITAGTNSTMDHRFCVAAVGANWIGASLQAHQSGDAAFLDPEEELIGEEAPRVLPPPKKPRTKSR